MILGPILVFLGQNSRQYWLFPETNLSEGRKWTFWQNNFLLHKKGAEMVLMGFPDKNILVFEISSLKTSIFYIKRILNGWKRWFLTSKVCRPDGPTVRWKCWAFSIFLGAKGPKSLGKPICSTPFSLKSVSKMTIFGNVWFSCRPSGWKSQLIDLVWLHWRNSYDIFIHSTLLVTKHVL